MIFFVFGELVFYLMLVQMFLEFLWKIIMFMLLGFFIGLGMFLNQCIGCWQMQRLSCWCRVMFREWMLLLIGVVSGFLMEIMQLCMVFRVFWGSQVFWLQIWVVFLLVQIFIQVILCLFLYVFFIVVLIILIMIGLILMLMLLFSMNGMIGFFGMFKDMLVFIVILLLVVGIWIFWYFMLNFVLWLKFCCSFLGQFSCLFGNYIFFSLNR